ncbi:MULTISPECIES: PstS family phosphate ABC transporter substrate-binding protein [unclassified Myroides]|uniref:PstS family phosphate ABC transporter substrate-binding protein n=1 Tax=unclassified Myroides TaxID=2642485 RepID=UPI003D2F73C6
MIRRKSAARIGILVGVLATSSLFFQCKDKHKTTNEASSETEAQEETLLSGTLTLGVDESVFPIVEDVAILFENEYKRAKINLLPKSEKEILQLLFSDSIRVAVLPRTLTTEELKHYEGVVAPKQTHFASDAIVFVTSKNAMDSIVDYQVILKQLEEGKATEADSFLVFDNYNSSVSSAFREATGFVSFPKDYAYFLNTTEEVIDYVVKNPKAIGVIGLNWLTQPTKEMQPTIDQVKVLAVKNDKDQQYYKPSQNNIAEGTYPLIRKLYVLDMQGKNGLGTGFASYIAGYKGQRVVLKSGLFPFNTPPREIVVTKEIK